MALTLAEAEKALQTAKVKAQEMGIRVSIAIVDGRGDPVALVRMDGARWFTADVSRGKAMASALFGRPSGEMAERADSPVFRSLVQMHGGHLIPGQGAVPIRHGEEVVGAVGVSGGTGQQDEEVARTGVSAL